MFFDEQKIVNQKPVFRISAMQSIIMKCTFSGLVLLAETSAARFCCYRHRINTDMGKFK